MYLDIENAKSDLIEWLSHNNEFGTAPVTIECVGTYSQNYLLCGGNHSTHLFQYEMDNGYNGIGFVNPITWSFDIENITKISHENLLHAYCGWLLLFLGNEEGTISTNVDEASVKYVTQMVKDQLSPSMTLISKYKIEDIIYLEFEGTYKGRKVKQAIGNDNSSYFVDETQPEFSFPAIWIMLGYIQQN